MCVGVCVHVCACMCKCMCMCVCACVCVCVSGVVVTKIINYSSFGFRPLNYTFKSTISI